MSFSPALLGLLSESCASCFKLGTVFLVSLVEKLGRHPLLICLFQSLVNSSTRYLPGTIVTIKVVHDTDHKHDHDPPVPPLTKLSQHTISHTIHQLVAPGSRVHG